MIEISVQDERVTIPELKRIIDYTSLSPNRIKSLKVNYDPSNSDKPYIINLSYEQSNYCNYLEQLLNSDRTISNKLEMDINHLELDTRTKNCLDCSNITNISELISHTEFELLKIKSFGKTSLRLVKRKLSELGLSLISHY